MPDSRVDYGIKDVRNITSQKKRMAGKTKVVEKRLVKRRIKKRREEVGGC